jgi:hypothetical protein
MRDIKLGFPFTVGDGIHWTAYFNVLIKLNTPFKIIDRRNCSVLTTHEFMMLLPNTWNG